MISRRALFFSLCVAFLRIHAIAQTAVTTTGGAMNTVPLFTAGSTIGNSSISQSNGNVGIGTTNPLALFSVQTGSQAPSTSGNVVNGLLLSSGLGSPSLSIGIKDTSIAGQQYGWLQTAYTNSAGTFGYLSFNPLGGYVGIGTSAPSAPLELSTPAAGNPSVVRIVRTGGNFGGEGPALEFDDYANSFPQGHIYTSLTYMDPTNSNGRFIFGSHTAQKYNDELTLEAGNVGIGIGTATPSAKLEVSGNVRLTSGSGASITFPDNTVQATAWNGTTFGGDYAESVDVVGLRSAYEAGDVLVLDAAHPGQFMKSSKPFSRLVAGVYSTKPGLTGHRHAIDDVVASPEVPMAMIGIVPTKVTCENGPIEVGDLLVTSSKEGYAMNAGPSNIPLGTVIGKAMASLQSGTSTIEVLITLQ